MIQSVMSPQIQNKIGYCQLRMIFFSKVQKEVEDISIASQRAKTLNPNLMGLFGIYCLDSCFPLKPHIDSSMETFYPSR